MLKSAIFLDRDGVINHNDVRNGRPYSPTSLTDFQILPGVPEAVTALHKAGYLIIVATNQPDVGAGRQTRDVVDAMYKQMRQTVYVDDIEVCYHVDQDNCNCRKPKPGMLLNAIKRHGIDVKESWMIGDRWRDVDAGRAAGCQTVFIDYGYANEPRPENSDIIVRSLAEAVPIVLNKSNIGESREE